MEKLATKKPRILLLMHYMELGGAESSLLGLMQSVDPNRAEVDLFVYDHRGELMSYIPKDKVNLLPEMSGYNLLERPLVEVLKRGRVDILFARLLGRFEARMHAKFHPSVLDNDAEFSYQQRRTERCLKQINPTVVYDLAISYVTPHYIALNKVKARKKMGWIHTDYTNIYVNVPMEEKMWGCLDYIASISPEVGKKFVSVFPRLADRIVNIENILSPSYIRLRAEEFVPNDMICNNPDTVKLLSIGRFCNPKRFDELASICKRVRGAGVDVHWFVIGYGDDTLIRKNIEEEQMQDHVTVLGKRANPYPYIKACDVYVQPSRYEGKSITVREAQILCKPVVVTNYPTASSQIQDGVDGVIVPMELDACARETSDIIRNKELQSHIITYLMQNDYGNESEIKKVYDLAELEVIR